MIMLADGCAPRQPLDRPSASADLADDLIRVAVAARITGISASMLRKWERRHGWPQSVNGPDGFRRYPSEVVATIDAVGHLLRSGRTIETIIADPSLGIRPRFDADEPDAHRVQPLSPLAGVPIPRSAVGKRLRRDLERALELGDVGALKRIEAESVHVRTDERQQFMNHTVPVRPLRPAHREPRRTWDFSRIPQPMTASGQSLRSELEQALLNNDQGTIRRIAAEAVLIKPCDRSNAVLALLDLVA